MEFDEHEEQDEEMEMQAAPPGYASVAESSRPKMGPAGEETVSSSRKRGTAAAPNSTTTTTLATMVRYRECLKNHAVSIGGHALDGCGEFLSAGDEGTMDALKCAACNCHRNFHRKESEGELIHHHQGAGGSHQLHHHHHQHQFSSGYCRPPPPPSGYLITSPHARPTLALPAASIRGGGGSHSREEGEDVSNPSSSGGGGGGGFGMSKKRHRTKFTQEQKEKMLEFAEKVGWRIQKHDEAAIEEFCGETGVKRHVLKVWMHNNKHTLVCGHFHLKTGTR
ncbi:zinc-finger homeodomain protein 2-like [Pyrus ussuriensis x Pyrus communis]|uniref:Zinc-finger homeodomain protein 2-like n=1 Tax=Pyrus ussuriensis x Pyrus communis TaxID=2448454 RepID=A0A5N5HLK3_9ROSA|nr:zinc-finger homeodomain protein 2-like [Pyrus ussuriensis x Pyrus communis]